MKTVKTDKAVLRLLVKNFDLEGADFHRWLKRNGLELTLSKEDDKLIRRYLSELLPPVKVGGK